jgi:hypothetical protein
LNDPRRRLPANATILSATLCRPFTLCPEEHQTLGAGHTSLDVLGDGKTLTQGECGLEVTLEAENGKLAGAAGGKFRHRLRR